MVSKRRRRLLGLLAAGSTVAVAGCSGGDGENGDENGNQSGDENGGDETESGPTDGTNGDNIVPDNSGDDQWLPYDLSAGERYEWELAVHEADGWLDASDIDATPGETGTVVIELVEESEDTVMETYTVEYGGTTETAEHEQRPPKGPEIFAPDPPIDLGGWARPIKGAIGNSEALARYFAWNSDGNLYSSFEFAVGASVSAEADSIDEENPAPNSKIRSEIRSQETHGGYDCYLIEESNYYGVYSEACATQEIAMVPYGTWYGFQDERELAESPRVEMTLTGYEAE